LHLALRAVSERGDIVLVESPCYFGILEIIENLGLRVVELATDPQEGIDLVELENVLKRFNRVAACVLVTNYSNPLGFSLSTSCKGNLVRLLARFGVPLIEDDIFGELYRPETERPKVAKSFDSDGSIILVGSLSKTRESETGVSPVDRWNRKDGRDARPTLLITAKKLLRSGKRRKFVLFL